MKKWIIQWMVLIAGIGFVPDFAFAETPVKGTSREMANAAVMPAEKPTLFVDADESNTVRATNKEEAFASDEKKPMGFWRNRPGKGFNRHQNESLYERISGDAPMLKTTVSGLESGKTYGVSVCFISNPKQSWRVRAGFDAYGFMQFTPTEPSGRITNLGPNKSSGLREYLGLIGDAKADAKGTISVYIDDAQGQNAHERTWYEGLALGAPTGQKTEPTITVGKPLTVWEERDVPNPISDQKRPNILWLTCEDISPYLGCYGFEQAQTPNLDKLAQYGVHYTRAYAATTVCSPSRSSLLTGMYSSTLGTQGIRGRTTLPAEIPAYPALFRKAGYYCTNNKKTDYNSSYESGPMKKLLWDQCSSKAHWKNRPKGKPFFAVFNDIITHESRMSMIDKLVKQGRIPTEPRINPADIRLPAYHPDLPEIRDDWARLHDLITAMDGDQGKLIQEVIDAGLFDDTIIIFNSDHGGMLSRSKHYIYNGGTQVPLIVRIPEKWKYLAPGLPGSANDEFVEFVDLPKTFLNICGIEVPKIMQGRVFLGPDKTPAPKTIHCYRDRQTERFDVSRAVTDGDYYFIRNFYPHKPRGRDFRYGLQMQKNWRAWEAWYDGNPEAAGPIYSQFYKPKATVELFDMAADPDQVHNIASDPALEDKLAALDADLDDWMIRTRDLGLVPESMLFDLTGEGSKYATLYEYGQSKDYPVEKILMAAKSASSWRAQDQSLYLDYMKDEEPAVRYWGAYALFLNRINNAQAQKALKAMIQKDAFAANRIMAAQALAWCGDSAAAYTAIMKEINPKVRNGYSYLLAINALQYSHTDKNLTKEDWNRFKQQAEAGRKREGQTSFGFDYSLRIINDALEIWPERRTVD